MDVIHRQFPSLAEFMQWKEQYETSSRSSFVLHCSPKERSSAGYVTYYYYCNRSGKYAARGKGKQQLKIQGSSKLDTHCPAYIRAKRHEDGQVRVELCEYHTHEMLLAHLPLPESTRQIVAANLLTELPFQQFLILFVMSLWME